MQNEGDDDNGEMVGAHLTRFFLLDLSFLFGCGTGLPSIGCNPQINDQVKAQSQIKETISNMYAPTPTVSSDVLYTLDYNPLDPGSWTESFRITGF